MIRGKKHTKHVILILFSFILVIVVLGIAFTIFKPMVKKVITLEAGSELVSVQEFLINDKSKGYYVSDITNIDLQTPGIYEIQIKVKNRIHRSTLEIIDTVAPTADTVDQIIVKGDTLEAEVFVVDIIDVTNVTVTYKNKPDFTKLGDQEVILVLEDTSSNQKELNANLRILDFKEAVVEAGSNRVITLEDFLDVGNYNAFFETDISALDFSKPTTYEILIKIDNKTVPTQLEVVDTTAPSATVVSQEIWFDETVEANAFVTDIIDVSPVKVQFKQEPDYNIIGEQEVLLVLEDEYNNQSELKAILTIKEDTIPPQIVGVKNRMVYIGDSISYRQGVSVVDNKDEKVELQIDSSEVNLKKEGSYEVTYTAIDSSGNKAVNTSIITVKEFVMEEDTVYKLADEVLAKITKDDMTLREKAWEIYVWVKGHVSYTGSSDKSSWVKEAYRGIKNGVGDCFTYYAVSEALLTRAGIENMRVTRVGGRTRHYWNLINCGEGWYHFDTCPHKDHFPSFMLTDAEVAKYTKLRGNNYYNFDKSLYPATPEN